MIWTELISLLVYCGFSGVLGALLRRGWLGWSLVFGGLVFLPVSLGLPDAWWARFVGWSLAVVVIMLYYKCPARLPGWLWGKTFAWFYLAGLMILISAWGVISGYVGVGAASGVAAILAAYRLGGIENH